MEAYNTIKPVKLPKLKIKNASTSPRRRVLQRNVQVSPYRITQGISVPRKNQKRLTPLKTGSIPDKSLIKIQDAFTKRILQDPRKIFDRIGQKMMAQKSQKYTIKQYSPTASTIDSLSATSLGSPIYEEANHLSNSTQVCLTQLNRDPTVHNLVSSPRAMQNAESNLTETNLNGLVYKYLNQESLQNTVYPMYNLPYDFSMVDRFELTSKVVSNELYESDYSCISLDDELKPQIAETPTMTEEDQAEIMLDYQDMIISKPSKKKNHIKKPQDFTGKLKLISLKM